MRNKGKKPAKLIHLTLTRAGQEFGLDPNTLKRRLAAAEISPVRGGYSIRQLCAAIYSDIDAEKLGLVREQRLKLERERAVDSGELIAKSELEPALGRAVDSIKQHIRSASNLENEDRDKICTATAQLLAVAFGARISLGHPTNATSTAPS
jgi:hypothetical protein